ncbi:membrane protein [Spirochaetia bacterium]|nr:membrane protein [Spirochaetia bacterium]
MKKIVTRCLIGVMVLFMASIFLRLFTQNVLIEILHMNNGFTQIVVYDKPVSEESVTNNINWAKLYPFQNNDTIKINKPIIFKERISGIEEKIEKYTKDYLVSRMNFVKSAARYEKLIGWNLLNGDVYDLGDGWLTELVKKVEILPSQSEQNVHDITTPAAALYEFNDFLADSDIGFLYVQSPHKISKEDKIIGASDFSNENADELLKALLLRHISYLDLRENIRQENLDHHSLFYKTDHHWKAETGLWAAGIIAEYLNVNNGFDIDLEVFDPKQYRYDVYADWFLGSAGKKVTLVQTPPEDISLIYPRFNTSFSSKIPSKNIDTEGAFDIFYDYRQVNEVDYYNLSPYVAYLYGDVPNVIIRNNFLYDNKRILVIKDSFVNCVNPFLSLGIEYVEVLDMRHFTGSVKTYIKQHKPDMVIVMYNPGSIKTPDYATHISLFDFR